MSFVQHYWRLAAERIQARGLGGEALTERRAWLGLNGAALATAILILLAPLAISAGLLSLWIGALAGVGIAVMATLRPTAERAKEGDVTDALASEATEAHESAHHEALLEVVGALVMRHEANGKVLVASAEARRQFDIAPDDLIGFGFFNRVHVADRPAFLQAVNIVRRGEGKASVTLRLRSGIVTKAASGIEEPNFAWAEIQLKRIFDGEGEAADRRECFLSVTKNITEAKDSARQLGVARAEAEMALSLKDRLLANVSHELRTPLNAILGFSEILGNPELAPSEPAKRIEYARIIHSSAEHLLSVVNLVLDMSKIEAGKFEIAPEPFDLESLISDCCDMLRLKAESGRVTLIREAVGEPLELMADKRACRQILLNVISNAVKFTPPDGKVTIATEIIEGSFHIVISDTGIGIAAEHLPRLGDPFFQVRSNYDRSFEGAGLGLSLVRGLVGLHGGSLLLASAPTVGTRVTIRLPVDCRAAPSAGVGASRLETQVLSHLEPRIAPRDMNLNAPQPREERKFA